MVIAPVFGFDDYQDYYRKTQSGQFLKGVRVPFLAVQVRRCPRLIDSDGTRYQTSSCTSTSIPTAFLGLDRLIRR